ncbi:hypothetical protein LTR64_002369 [Lithohypha guttulata]|uniref:HTH APSES-type domain-containing protein n=1 Tax=Lithohypha guttulata TaxID=1690604 RepID=A0AAN7SX37_9EURO|nr:hypothetical protein LTR05_005947 [Lithohypha guttulata]
MFKIAFPWAKHAEERAEREYLKSLESTSHDDVAGNVWVSPESALELAEDYGLEHWIRALLDPADIQSSPTSARKNISEPPKFELSASLKENVKLSPPASLGKRGRGARSSSPMKATPQRVKASPRKRQTKKEKEANTAYANAASASLQSALDDAASVAEATPAPESVVNDTEHTNSELDGEIPAPESPVDESKVRVEVDQEVEVNGDTEVTHTNVTVEMPASLPELSIPQDTESMLRQAKEMVEKAKELESSPRPSRSKRKIEEVEPSDVDAELPVQPTKRAKLLEEKLKREKVRTRAVFGVAASLAVAAAIPFFQTFF